MTVIRYAEDEFGVNSWSAWLDVLDARAAAIGQPRPPRPDGEDAAAPPVYARMNHARWLAECGCGSAVLLFRGGPGAWFWCPSCGNAVAAGKLRPVLWPPDRDRIDTNMASLPEGLAHWDPQEAA